MGEVTREQAMAALANISGAVVTDESTVRSYIAQLEARVADEQQTLLILTAAATAHRGCCGTEHDTSQGKLHGYCVVCGIPWPCPTASVFINAALRADAAKAKENDNG